MTKAPPRHRDLSLAFWCVVAAFGTYFCMYAFRKPFTAASYEDTKLWGLGYKTVLVIAQVLGYCLSKFLGIKVVSEIEPRRRVYRLLTLIAGAEVALLLFAVTPSPYNFGWLFCNGLYLGMVFGLVLGFLEGRRHTEALAAGLCTSFIVADGVVKSVGAYLLEAGVTEYWMPFVAGLCFLPALLLFCWMLTQIPPPTLQDIAARSERTTMTSAERSGFFRRYSFGLTLLILGYLLITVLRSVRADFQPEIWRGLLKDEVAEKVNAVALVASAMVPFTPSVAPKLFALSELAVGLGILIPIGAAVFLGDNRRAFFFGLGLSVAGAVLLGLALLGLDSGALTPFAFMVLNGIGLYLPYIAVHTILFERFLAMTRERGNIGYLMYLADSFGYLGYVAVLLAKNLLGTTENFLDFFVVLSWVISAGCLILLIPCWRYFATYAATRSASVGAVA